MKQIIFKIKFALLFSVITMLSLKTVAFNGLAKISGTCEFLKEGDTVELIVHRSSIGMMNPEFQRIHLVRVNKSRRFKFEFDCEDAPEYFDLVFPSHSNHNVSLYLIQNGMDVKIKILDDSIIFAGDKKPLELIYQIRSHFGRSIKDLPSWNESNVIAYFKKYDSIANEELKIAYQNKNLIEGPLWNIIMSDIIYGIELSKLYFMNIYGNMNRSGKYPYLEKYEKYRKEKYRTVDQSACNFRSVNYMNYLVEKYQFDSCVQPHRKLDVKCFYSFIDKNYKDSVAERLFAILFLNFSRDAGDLSSVFNQGIHLVNNHVIKLYIDEIKRSRIPGASAFNFNSTSADEKKIQLSDLKGNVVVLDFWFTGCGGCREVAPYLSAIEKSFTSKEVKFISISVDKDKRTWLQSLEGQSYATKESINIYTDGLGDAHPIIRNFQILEYPTLILINKEGKIMANPIDPRVDNGRNLTSLINECLNFQ